MPKKFFILLFGFSAAVICYAQDVAVFPQLGHTRFVKSIVFSPDGKQVLSGSNDTTIKLWDAASGREIRTFSGHSNNVNSLAFSPDGKQALSGSDDRTVKLWDIANGREIRTFSGHLYPVNSVAFSPDGKQVLSGSNDETIKLWDAESGREIKTFKGHTEYVMSVAFSLDGKHILSISGSVKRLDMLNIKVKLWDIASGQEIKTFSGQTSPVYSVAFSPDRKQVLSGSKDGTVILWDATSGREIRTFLGHRTDVKSLAFSPDGKQVLSGSWDNTVKLWDAESGQEIRTFSKYSTITSAHVESVAFSPDGKQVLSGFRDNTVKLWDIASGQEIRTFCGQSKSARSVAFGPDGKQIFSCSSDYTVKLWDIASGQVIKTFSGHSFLNCSVAFSPNGKQVLFSYSNDMKLWDMASGREIRTFKGHTSTVWSVAFSPDGKQVLSGSNDTIKLWDAASGQELRTFSGQTSSVSSVAFSPDGKQVLSGDWNNTVKLWDIASGQVIRTFSGGGGHVAFSPDGTRILSGSSDGTVKLWDATSGREIRTFSGHTGYVASVAFSPDGKQILSGSGDRTVKLWDVASGREIRTFFGHTFYVASVAFSPDGKQILSGSDDGTVRLWDVSTGKEIVQFVSFSGSDSQLTSASRGLTVETETAITSSDGEWLVITPDGYYAASPRGDRYINVRVNNTVSGIDSFRSTFYNPDVVQARLQGRPDPASKSGFTIQDAAKFIPPTVTIQSPANFSTTNTGTTNLSVAITSQSQPIQNIKIIVNGTLIGSKELAAVKGTGLQPQKASLTVTGNQKTVNFTLPINLDPGRNIIEVVAFNGYSESPRLPVEVTWNAPANQRPVLPNLWILAVGVNNYQDSTIRNLNYCVADAKGMIESLKAQEGKRFAKVNSLLIADGEKLPPTAANIRQNLRFLDQAGERDVVLLFLAGHGVSDNAGKFFFLPNDTRLNANKTVAENTAISDGDIVKVLDRAGNLLVFIDACQSGGVDNDRLVRSLMETNAFVFTSSRGNELSQERREFGHGVFTYSVMQALKGATQAVAQGNVTVLSLSGFVSLDVPRITNGAQNPKAYSLGFYDFPVAVIK